MHRTEEGQVGGLEAIAFGVLVLVIGVLIVSNAWGVIDARTAATEAAREAARTYATAPAQTDAEADGLAQQAAVATLNELGWHGPGITVRRVEGTFVRCALVTYEVDISVPVFRLPWVQSSLSAFRARATDSERVDPYRSGVPATGAANCDAP
jgi:Flp pilus assembly protein TadG